MANNNGETDTSIAQDLQPWFFPPQTLAANRPWNVFPVKNNERTFSVMNNEPQPHNKAVAYNSFVNHGLEETSQLSLETMEHDKETEWRHRLASDGSGEEDEQRPSKRPQAKNLVAERKRREKIRNGLHALRAIVPKITKMDKASILGDAIEYVKELQKQVKDLQDQLEGDDGISQLELPITPGELMSQGGRRPSSSSDDDDDKQQMEPQVEVKQLVASSLNLMVLCEHRRGGFARLMEAINGLGLEVTNATVTTFRSLVLNVFRVEGREDTVLKAEEVTDSLADVMRGCYKALQTSDSQGQQRQRVSQPPAGQS